MPDAPNTAPNLFDGAYKAARTFIAENAGGRHLREQELAKPEFCGSAILEKGHRLFFIGQAYFYELLRGALFVDRGLCRTILRKDFLDDRAISVELYGV